MAFIKLEDKNTGKWSGISLQLHDVGEALCLHLNPVWKVNAFKDISTINVTCQASELVNYEEML